MPAPGLFTVLSNIPWGPVLDAAPKVADGATRLWDAVRRKRDDPAAPATAATAGSTDPAPIADPLAEVEARIAALQTAVDHQGDEMRAASELIKALADQNTALIQRVELHRLRLVRLAAVGAAIGGTLLAGVISLWIRTS